MGERFGKCPYATAQSLISGKWAILILHYLEDGHIRFNELQTLLDGFCKQSRDAQKFAKLVEAYTDITEVTEELLHTLVDKIVVHEKNEHNTAVIIKYPFRTTDFTILISHK